MSDKVFVDTNILVYARDASEPEKQVRAEALVRDLWQGRTGRISTQVLNEYFVTVTRKLSPGLSDEQAWRDIEDLASWSPLPVNMELLQRGHSFHERFSLSWWDSLILAAAEMSGCGKVYSEDLSHDQTYFGVQVVNPFL